MKIFSFNNIGSRASQEDSVLLDQKHRIFAVLDGVGSNQNGGLASRIIKQYLEQVLAETKPSFDVEDIRELIIKSENELAKTFEKNSNYKNMATTIALLFLCDDNRATSFHLGDSRVYYFEHKNNNWSVTKDHSMYQYLIDNGSSVEEGDYRKNQLTDALTTKKRAEPLILRKSTIENLNDGDLFLLVTDGALENHSDKDLTKHFFNDGITLEDKWKQFSTLCETNSQDNNSAILIQL